MKKVNQAKKHLKRTEDGTAVIWFAIRQHYLRRYMIWIGLLQNKSNSTYHLYDHSFRVAYLNWRNSS